MTDGFSRRDKLGCATVTFLFWLMLPFPFWMLGVGFAGEFSLPDFNVSGDYPSPLWVGFDLLFYLPLLLTAVLVWSAVRPRRNSDDPDNA